MPAEVAAASVNRRSNFFEIAFGQSMRCTIPSRDQVDPDTPLRLNVAAALAFPDGSMTASGLRREATRARFVIGLQEGSRQHEVGRT
jgi:hypothetical protein